jgi:hypothetical protein
VVDVSRRPFFPAQGDRMRPAKGATIAGALSAARQFRLAAVRPAVGRVKMAG